MPSAAERTRTLVQGTCSAVLLIPGATAPLLDQLAPDARAVGPDGEVLLLYPADSPAVRAATHAQDDELPAVLELTDVAPVAVPNRVRGRAWASGWLTVLPGVAAEPGHTMLRLEVGDLYVDDLWGADPVDPEEFARAVPDPLRHHETELLQHLAAAHDDQMLALTALLGERAGTGPSAVREVVPLALDRFGLRVRCRDADRRTFDARFDFPEPVRDVHGLRRAMHALFEAAAQED
ncbi:DUF2470 domain-containing protein [Streptomyces kanasensis]|uniref:DUF2470 domain-containing protein n=1 Tax=Streptomyces kanasensis TaxID=936756 RepID=UPI0036FC668D